MLFPYRRRWEEVIQAWENQGGRGYLWEGEPPPEVPPQALPRGQDRNFWQRDDTLWAVGLFEGHGIALQGTPDQAALMKTLLGLALDWARELVLERQLTEELLLAWDWLNFLFQLAQAVGQTHQPTLLMEQVVQQLHQVLPAQEVFLVIEEPPERRVFTSGNPEHTGREVWPLLLDLEVVTETGWVRWLTEKTAPPALRVRWDPTWQHLALVSLPLTPPYRGILGLRDLPEGQLSAGQQHLLLAGAEQIATLLNLSYTRWMQERTLRLEQELSIARTIQERMLPESLPQLPEVEFGHRLEPASQIGGDFYDVLTVNGRLLLMLGDVAGKGVPAAMLTALMHAAFHAEGSLGGPPNEMLTRIHRYVYGELERAEAFITLALLEVNPKTGHYRYASAGHPDLVIIHDDGQELTHRGATGLPLGVLAEPDYDCLEGILSPGDVLWLYSDGVTETESPSGRVFGRNGLLDIALALSPAPAQAQVDGVLEAIQLHRGDQPLRDDLALLVLRFRKAQEPLAVWPFVHPSTLQAAQQLAQEAKRFIQPWALRLHPETALPTAQTWELAVAELATNIVRHAYRTFSGRLQGCCLIWPNRCEMRLWDSGHRFSTSPLPRFNPTEPPESGYGLRLLHRLMDRVVYRRRFDRNFWLLERAWKSNQGVLP